MAGREISRQQREWLAGEIDVWRQQGLIDAETARSVLDQYVSPAEIARSKQSLALNVLMSVAALLVGVAVLLLVGYNWQTLPAAVKVVLVFGAILGTHALGFWLRYRRQTRIVSEIAFFLGCLFFGVGIWQVAQIFHLNVHYPDGVWWWAVGVLPFALCLETPLLHALLVALLAIWCGTEVLGFGDLGGWFFGRWRHFPNGAYTLPLLALPGLLWAYRRRSLWTIGMYVPLIAWWLVLQPFAWDWEGEHVVFFVGSVGALLLIIAENHREGSAFAIPFRTYGVLISAGVVLLLSFHDFNDEVFRGRTSLEGLLQTLVIVGLSVVVIVVAALMRRRQQSASGGEQVRVQDEVLGIVRRQWLPVGMLALMAFCALWLSLLDEPLLPTVLANAALVALSIWLMRLGLQEDRGLPFAAGVVYFLVWTIARYVDLFGDFGGMLGASLMFFLCGAALFGVALYWRRRRKEVRHV